MAIQDTDYLLVNRNSTNYRQAASNIMAIQDTDLLLVSRGGTNYKVTGAEVKDYASSGVFILYPEKNASIPGVNFTATSSPWHSDTGVTHLSSTWELTLSSDPTFSNPVKQVIDSTSDLTSWFVSGLIPGQGYLIRVTYNLSNSTQTVSNTVNFSIASNASPFISGPPTSVISGEGGPFSYGPLNQYLTPTPVVSFRWDYNSATILCATEDGDTMSFRTTSVTGYAGIYNPVINSTPLPNGDRALDVFVGTNANNTYYVNQDGYIKRIGTPPFIIDDALLSQKIKRVTSYDLWGSLCVQTENNELWVIGSNSVQNPGTVSNGQVYVLSDTARRVWSPSFQDYFKTPPGEIPIKVVTYYLNYVVWLTDQNNAYLTSPAYTIGSAPIQWTSQGAGATFTNPVKIRPYPFNTAPDYVWEDIFSGAIGGGGNIRPYSWWGITSESKVRGTWGWVNGALPGPGEQGHGTSLGATDAAFFGNKVVVEVTGNWWFYYGPIADGIVSGNPGLFYSTPDGKVFGASFYDVGAEVSVTVPNVKPLRLLNPIGIARPVAALANNRMFVSKPLYQY